MEDVKIKIYKREQTAADTVIDGKRINKKYQSGEGIGPLVWNVDYSDSAGYYRIQLEVKIKGYTNALQTEIKDADDDVPNWQCPQTCLAVDDLIWKHRPLLYVHASHNDTSGTNNTDLPIDPEIYVSECALFEKQGSWPLQYGVPIESSPTKESMLNHSSINHYLCLKGEGGVVEDVLHDKKILNLTPTPTLLFSTNQTDSKDHVFLQFWLFSSWSAGFHAPDDAFHEGDIEFFQIAIAKKDTRKNSGILKKNWVAPTAVFLSQHYYGQTIEWDRMIEERALNGRVWEQYYINHKGNRPKIYIAKGTHAVNGAQGSYNVGAGKLGDFPQYSERGWFREITGDKEFENIRLVPVDYLNGFFKVWKGRWGRKGSPPGGHDNADGPFGPPYRGGLHKNDSTAKFLDVPVDIHNTCIYKKIPADVSQRIRIGR